MVSKSVKELLIFLAIIAICIIVYTRYFSGIFIEYDDAVYGYAIATQNPVLFQTSFPGSLGLIAYGYPFFLAFGNSLYMPTFVGLSSILITIFLIFMIGKELNSLIVGVVGSIFYALNPLVISYSTRLIPDTFTTMVLCLSILIVLIASKRKNNYLFLLSGFVAGLRLFFGLQGFLVMFAFFVFAVVYLFAIGRGKKKAGSKAHYVPILLILFGMIIGFVVWLLPQQILYGNPLRAIRFSSSFWYSISGSLSQSYNQSNSRYFYVYLTFPTNRLGQIVSDTEEPYSNIGILAFIFILMSIVAVAQRRNFRKLLPYQISATAFILYLLFGTQSLHAYSHLMHINRLMIPFVLLLAIGSAYAIELIESKELVKYALIGCLIAAFVISSFYFSTYSAAFYGATHGLYENVSNIGLAFRGINASNYTVYENYSTVPAALCMVLKVNPDNCIVEQNLPANLCSQNRTILVYEGRELCSGNHVYENGNLYVNLIK